MISCVITPPIPVLSYTCANELTADPSSVCGENCEDILRENEEMCPSIATGTYTNALNTWCSNGGTPNVDTGGIKVALISIISSLILAAAATL